MNFCGAEGVTTNIIINIGFKKTSEGCDTQPGKFLLLCIFFLHRQFSSSLHPLNFSFRPPDFSLHNYLVGMRWVALYFCFNDKTKEFINN